MCYIQSTNSQQIDAKGFQFDTEKIIWSITNLLNRGFCKRVSFQGQYKYFTVCMTENIIFILFYLGVMYTDFT